MGLKINLRFLISDISDFWEEMSEIKGVGFGRTYEDTPLLFVDLEAGEVLKSDELKTFLEKNDEKLSDDIFIHLAKVYKDNPQMLYRRYWG